MIILDKPKGGGPPKTRIFMGYSTELAVKGKRYTLVTECEGDASAVSRLYYKGRMLDVRNHETGKDFDPMQVQKVELLLRKCHQARLKEIEQEGVKKVREPEEFVTEAQLYLKRKQPDEAVRVLGEGMAAYPDDMTMLSYMGVVTAVFTNDAKTGLEYSKRAMDIADRREAIGQSVPNKAVIYLNLCRSYLSAGNKKDAVDTLLKGMKHDTRDAILHKELVKLGIRRKPVVPFLKRGNPINKYIGMMLHRMESK